MTWICETIDSNQLWNWKLIHFFSFPYSIHDLWYLCMSFFSYVVIKSSTTGSFNAILDEQKILMIDIFRLSTVWLAAGPSTESLLLGLQLLKHHTNTFNDSTPFCLMNPSLKRFQIFIAALLKWNFLNQNWLAHIDLRNHIMNHDTGLVNASFHPCSMSPLNCILLVKC